MPNREGSYSERITGEKTEMQAVVLALLEIANAIYTLKEKS